jgi:hypothetical protein
MLNWQDDLKRYIAKKFKQATGEEIPLANIKTVEVHADIDLAKLSITELTYMYAFSLMKEDFEHAQRIADVIKEKKHRIEIETDDSKRIGSVNVYKDTKRKSKVVAHVSLKVLPDGMMIDFEKEEF